MISVAILCEWRDRSLNFKIPYIAGKQKESDLIDDNPFTYLGKEQNDDFEEIYTKIEGANEFNAIELKKAISNLKKKLKKYNISFRKLLSYAPNQEDSIFMCIKTAKVIAEDEWLLEKISRKKSLPIKSILSVVNVYHGTLERNSKFIIALSMIILSGLKSLNRYIDQVYTKKETKTNIGTILEVARDGMIVMCGNCNFMLLRKRKGIFVGQQIEFADWEVKEYNKSRVKRVVYLASIVFLGAVTLSVVNHILHMPAVDKSYAVVNIDINPSLEFLVDRENLVVGVNTINRDADILLMDNDLKGMQVDDAIEKVFEFAHDRGFVYEDKENIVLVSLALNPNGDKKGNEEEKLNNLLDQIKSAARGDDVIIPVVITVPQDTVKSANANNLSIGRQYIYEKSKENIKTLDLGQVRTNSIEELLVEFNIGRLN